MSGAGRIGDAWHAEHILAAARTACPNRHLQPPGQRDARSSSRRLLPTRPRLLLRATPSWAERRAGSDPARSRSQSTVLPSISVKRKVTVEKGHIGHDPCPFVRPACCFPISHGQRSGYVRDAHHLIIRLMPIYRTSRSRITRAAVYGGRCVRDGSGLNGEQRSESSGSSAALGKNWFR